MTKRRSSSAFQGSSTKEDLPPLNPQVGDIVAYTAAFLRSTGQVTGPAGGYRGKILAVDPVDPRDGWQIVTVQWDHYPAGETTRVNAANLAKPGPNRRFCAC